MQLSLLRIISTLTGLIISGEALALLIGMHWLSHPWITLKNDLFIVTDIVTGAGVILSTTLMIPATKTFFYAIIIFSLVTHLIRDREFLRRTSDPFCSNASLFIVNNLKITGLCLSLFVEHSQYFWQ